MANNENNSASYMTRRIGGTTYKVRVCFSETAQEMKRRRTAALPVSLFLLCPLS